MAYYRKGDKTYLWLAIISGMSRKLHFHQNAKVLINNYPDMGSDGNSVKLHGYQVLVVELKVNDFDNVPRGVLCAWYFIVFQHLIDNFSHYYNNKRTELVHRLRGN